MLPKEAVKTALRRAGLFPAARSLVRRISREVQAGSQADGRTEGRFLERELPRSSPRSISKSPLHLTNFSLDVPVGYGKNRSTNTKAGEIE